MDIERLKNQPTFQARKLRRIIASKLGRYEAKKKCMYLSAIEAYLAEPDNIKEQEQVLEHDRVNGIIHFHDGSKWFIEQNYTEMEDRTAFVALDKGYLRDMTDEHWGISAEAELARPQDGYRGKELDAEEFGDKEAFNDGQNYEKFEFDYNRDADRVELIQLYKVLANDTIKADAELNHTNMLKFDNIERQHQERELIRRNQAALRNISIETIYKEENEIEDAKFPELLKPASKIEYVFDDTTIYHSVKDIPINLDVINAYLAKRKNKPTTENGSLPPHQHEAVARLNEVTNNV
jgi:hypothetical protein